MSDELPQGWAESTLGELTDAPKQSIISGPFGSNLKCNEYVNEGVPIIRLQNVDRNKFLDKNIRYVTPQKAQELEAHSFLAGDIVISKLGDPLGKACTVPEKFSSGIVVADVVRLRLDDVFVSKKFVMYAINSPSVIEQINQEIKGSTRPRVNLNHIRDLRIAVAPLYEQRRIVEQLDKVLAKVEASRKRLENIPRKLKRFRQSVLSAACSGQLTEDWREDNGRNQDDWATVKLDDIADHRLGKMLDDAKNVGKPTAYLRNTNVRWFAFDLSDVAAMRATSQERGQLNIKDGDLLVCEGGEPGRCAVWNNGKTNIIFQKAIHRVRPYDSVSSKWIAFNLRLDAETLRLEEYFTGTTIKHLTGQSLAKYSFPLPSIEEQHEIVRRVEQLFTLADRIEERYRKANAHVQKLTQSILAKAFRGELVPQDPSDEPAEKLLERIREERGRNNGTGTPTVRKRTGRRTQPS